GVRCARRKHRQAFDDHGADAGISPRDSGAATATKHGGLFGRHRLLPLEDGAAKRDGRGNACGAQRKTHGGKMNRNELAKYVKPDTAMMLETLSRQAGRDAVEVAEELHPEFAETNPEGKASEFE